MKIFCTQIVPNAIKKIPTKPINTGFVGIYLFTQTRYRQLYIVSNKIRHHHILYNYS